MIKFSERSDEEDERGMKKRERKKKKEMAMRISLSFLYSLLSMETGEVQIV